MKNYYLVDYENVNGNGLVGCEKINGNDVIVVFYTDSVKKLNMDDLSGKGPLNMQIEKVPQGNQILDKHIASYLGYLIGSEENNQISVAIISNDKGYDSLISFWHLKTNISVSRNSCILDAINCTENEMLSTDAKDKNRNPKDDKAQKIEADACVTAKNILTKAKYKKVDIDAIVEIIKEHLSDDKKEYLPNVQKDINSKLGKKRGNDAYDRLRKHIKKK